MKDDEVEDLKFVILNLTIGALAVTGLGLGSTFSYVTWRRPEEG